MVYSFDIYDTCVVRTCGQPDNVFRILAKKLGLNECQSHSFVRGRKLAEIDAIKGLKKGAVTIFEIYQFFELSVYTDKTKDEVLKMEVDIDISSLAPVKKVIDKINRLRKKGKIIFISDMYLPYETLKNALEQMGILKNDSLYVSGDIGLTKRSGKLFDYVKNKEHLSFFNWKHYGDNALSDFIIPCRKGIRANRLRNPYTDEERILEKNAQIMGDLQLSVLSGICRSIRLEYPDKANAAFVTGVMVPLFLSFTLSVLQDVKNKGITKLFFAARDTYLMYKIAEVFVPVFPEIEINYLHVSTKVIYPIVISEGSEEEIRKLLTILYTFRCGDVLKIFGYSDNEQTEIAERIDLNKEVDLSSTESEELIKWLLLEKNNQKLKEKCYQKRKVLKQYLKQEGLLSIDDNKVAIVDIGWRGTSQYFLNSIEELRCDYYYLGASKYRLPYKETQDFKSFIYAEDSDWFSRLQLTSVH